MREWLVGDGPVGTLQGSGILQASINIRTAVINNSKSMAKDTASWPGGCRRHTGKAAIFPQSLWAAALSLGSSSWLILQSDMQEHNLGACFCMAPFWDPRLKLQRTEACCEFRSVTSPEAPALIKQQGGNSVS